MKRFVPLALTGWLLIAAASARDELPVPPIPPDRHPADETAPIPDVNAHGPAEAAESRFRLAPSLYRHEKTFTPGEGYMPGSSFKENEQERLSKPTPGLDLRVRVP